MSRDRVENRGSISRVTFEQKFIECPSIKVESKVAGLSVSITRVLLWGWLGWKEAKNKDKTVFEGEQ